MPTNAPNGRSQPVNDHLSARTAVITRPLELVTELDFVPFVFGWTNQSEIVRYSTSLLTLVDLLRRVGQLDRWAWIRTWPVDDPNALAQACGQADRGLLVEIGWRRATSQVVRNGAARFPRMNVATPAWPCWSSLDELHGLGEAAAIMSDWLIDRAVESRFELRAPDPYASR